MSFVNKIEFTNFKYDFLVRYAINIDMSIILECVDEVVLHE
jgi:uncharacterized protein with HEPN domain